MFIIDIYSPTEFVFGKDRENECGKYGRNRVLIHYGSGSARKAVYRSPNLEEYSRDLDEYRANVQNNAREELIKKNNRTETACKRRTLRRISS